ncbi:MAG: glycolate oxidase subunit GlcE [Alphaproteobacteria bacterium]|nr:glycolate oxidase subunit GlcE [Alphaproteobacteria bacterium]
MQLAEPTTEEELCEVVRAAVVHNVPLEVLGGGTKRAIGRPTVATQAVTTRRMSGIIDYDPTELVISAHAGTPLHTIRAALAERAQHFAFEPRSPSGLFDIPGEETVGGVVATNLSGARRFVAGAVRDHLLGFRAVSGRGEVFKSGGRVVKNVTGYDLSKLVTGSFGTLAVLTEVTLRVMPQPAETGTLVLSGVGIDDIVAVFDTASQVGAFTAGVFLTSASLSAMPQPVTVDHSAVALRFEGDTACAAARVTAQAFVGRYGATILETEESLKLWAQIRDLGYLSGAAGAVWRVSLARTSVAAFVAGLGLPEDAPLGVDWAGGQVWFVDKDSIDVRKALKAAAGPDGHATLIRAGSAGRPEVFHPQPDPVAALSRRIKHHFDPKGVLNPGRMYAGI